MARLRAQGARIWILWKELWNPLEIRFHSPLSFASLPLFFWHLRQFKDYEFNNFGWFSAFETKWIGFVDFSTEKRERETPVVRPPPSCRVVANVLRFTLNESLDRSAKTSFGHGCRNDEGEIVWESAEHNNTFSLLRFGGVLNVMKNLHGHSRRVWSDQQRTNCLNEVDRANLRN